MQHTSLVKRGFTLIELVIVLPVIIMIIGGLVVAIVHVTQTAMVMQARSQLQLDVLSALDQIEQDVKTAVSINTGSTSNLVTSNLATDRNPLDSNRRLFNSSTCSVVTGGLPTADALTISTTYSVHNGEYSRHTSRNACTTTSAVWQPHNNRAALISNVSSISASIAYEANGSPAVNTARVTLTASRKVVGRTISYSGVMHAKSINIR